MFIEPVFGKKFFGREEVLATLQKRASAMRSGYRQNLALAGPMLAGKSSILRHFLKNTIDTDITPLYVEMSDASFPVFTMRFMATLLYQHLKAKGGEVESDFDGLKEMCAKDLPKTVSQIGEICALLKKRKYDDAYETLLDLTSVFKSETGKNCIVILDEFHNLANFGLKKPFQTFGKFIMVQKSTMYIVSSSQKTLLRDILSKKLSLLFGNFEIIEVNGFDTPTALSFLADKLKETHVSENVKNYVIGLSQGNPFYIETITKEFLSVKKSKENPSDRECLLAALAKLLYESNGILGQYFMNNMNFFLEKKTRKHFIPVLTALAKGNCTLKAIRKNLGRSDKDLGKKLSDLEHMDLIERNGVFSRIQDKLFEFWLKYVYSIKANSVVDDMDVRYLEFMSLIEKDLDRYAEHAAKSTADIITELFLAFNGEKVRINMHEKKLARFSAVAAEKAENGALRITAGTDRKHKWLIHMNDSFTCDERTVSSLAALKADSAGNKFVRKIIIPLKGIEHNAFLSAKENNIWVWSAGQINELLRLYGKPELLI